MRNAKSAKTTLLALVGALLGALLLATSNPVQAAPCTGPGAPTTTQTQCLTAVQIPGNPLRSFDISWDNPNRNEYYLADRSNKGIDIIDTALDTRSSGPSAASSVSSYFQAVL
jgi:hypothetical protein